ncbi:uncharacterized protein XM38_036490 [Halomicronema hongdechloris C2206]|uniref:Plastid lipid-associated protein/fibrillin conserved domain-containing protein n=1 Tax=Halomicronema hongdechloris C2206 TaxID=1641165 RepID=A0A1Z3HQV7_9CYAN|nr:fimbrial protein [Halomicronema hongdechloris]ASC72691.1 uncharacterized protein XM38_036490 [Halomicronema hongdechloris C2206]
MTTDTTHLADRLAAKAALRQVLAEHDGDPHHEAVAAAIDTLAALNPTPAPTQTPDLLEGELRLISAPSFPDGQKLDDGSYCYSLGRLAFDMFQPRNLRLVINQVWQPVWPIQGGPQRSHDIVVDFTTRQDNEPPLRGIVRNLGGCEPANDTALRVWFTGGVLEPAPGTDLSQWNTVFGDQTQPAPDSLKSWFQGLFLKLMFGLVPPAGIDPNTGRVEFQMKRSPKGSLTILYLDEELRITRGHKETVLICDRISL